MLFLRELGIVEEDTNINMEIIINIENCTKCPHFKITGTSSTDGFDRGEDWHCVKADRPIAGFVEWHEHPEIPSWCPCRVKKQKNTKDKWKDLSKEKPEVNKDLILWDGFARIRGWMNVKGEFVSTAATFDSYYPVSITHWMLLPEPPKKNKKKE